MSLNRKEYLRQYHIRRKAEDPSYGKRRNNSSTHYNRRLLKNDPVKYHYYQKKRTAQHAGHDFTITIDDLRAVWTDTCPILDKPMCYGHPLFAHSIDRIDSSKGYVPGNIQVMSRRANSMKSNATVYGLQRFAAGINRLYGLLEE